MNLRSKKYLNYKNLFKFFKIDLKNQLNSFLIVKFKKIL